MSDTKKKPVLKPANDNPWYCLATLYGEQLRSDEGLQAKNRNAWNRWIAPSLSKEQLTELAKNGFETEVEPLTAEERDEFLRAFALRTGRDEQPPEPGHDVNFSRTHFDCDVSFRDFVFTGPIDFTYATFSRYAYFRGAHFFETADFHFATFSRVPDFSYANFYRSTTLNAVTFSDDAGFNSFSSTTFGEVSFDGATFSSHADFTSTVFLDRVDFSSVTFSREANFVNAKFSSMTTFANAIFETHVPDFRGATLHEATEWHGVIWPKPPSQEDAQQQVYAYERLKLEMERLKKHEDEQTFFRKELRARRGLFRVFSGAWLLNFIYQATSDYGNSIVRPLLWLLGVFALGAATFAYAPLHCGARMPIKLAIKISFANIFVFLPDKREIMTPELLSCWSGTARIVSAAQSLFGVVLLFLIVLAIRNRFRMKGSS